VLISLPFIGPKHNEQLMGAIVHGRNKFFSLMAGKSQSPKYVGRTISFLNHL